ncbi:MAG: hypothetical protein P1P82_03325 [Bacteroidales bacterium]|nr:hypothetical protein [Bacteroidales bacterium]MDT8432005.1 hypothetical protein [Bacteroidales bacterium]
MLVLRNKLIIITVFAISMGLLESAVVIYLREIMYPEGFKFPLAPIHPHLVLTEILREASTLGMLVCIGLLAAKSFSQRFAWFVYSFAIWDIFYYVFLWLLLGWPESLMTWDVLFLIPATWTGPVITPLLITLLILLLSAAILVNGERGKNTRLWPLEWAGLIAGSVIVVVAFITDYMKHMLASFSFGELLNISDPRLMEAAQEYVPARFPWLLFTVGFLVILYAIIHYILRLNKQRR